MLTILEGQDAQARVDLLTQCFASYQKVANLRVCYALPINKRSILHVKLDGKSNYYKFYLFNIFCNFQLTNFICLIFFVL